MTVTCRHQVAGTLLVGIDIVPVREVADSIRTYGDRYLKRVFTDQELRDCGSDARQLAARFAVKEATIKALRVHDEPLGWTSITVHDATGRPSLELGGAADRIARKQGVRELSVSLRLGSERATAIVLADLRGS